MNQPTEQKKGKAKHLKLVIQILFFAALTVLAFYYILKDDPKRTFAILSQARALPLTVAGIIVILTILLDGASLTVLTKRYNRKYHYYQGLINTLIGGLVGVYVKSAAPLLQAYTFQKQDVENSEAASVLTTNFLLYQLSLCLYSTVIILCGYPLMKNVPLPLLWNMKLLYLVLFGMAVQLLFLIGAILLAYCRPLHRFFLNTGINILGKLHILPKPEETRRRLTIQFATYRIEMKRMKANKKEVALVLFFNLLRLFLLGTLPFFVFNSLIPSGANTIEFFSKSIVGTGFVNVISSFITVGAPEIIFQDTFSYFLKDVSTITNFESLASAANILWRLFTFYLIFFLGILTTLLYRGSPKRVEILSNTQTIYDLELADLKIEDEDTLDYLKEIKEKGKKENAPLLTKEEIIHSFDEIKNTISKNDSEKEEKIENKDLEEILKEEQQQLAKAVEEYQELVKAKPSKDEIEIESQKEFNFFLEKRRKKIENKKRRKERKAQREEKRERKKLLKRQPKGTTIKVDDIKGIEFISPEFTEMKTITTSDPDEDKRK